MKGLGSRSWRVSVASASALALALALDRYIALTPQSWVHQMRGLPLGFMSSLTDRVICMLIVTERVTFMKVWI